MVSQQPRAGHVLVNSLGMKLAFIPAGDFDMGLECPPEEAARLYGGATDWYANEQPQHHVKVTRPLRLGATHVTRADYAAFVAATGYKTDGEREDFSQVWNGSKFAKTQGYSWRNPGIEQTDAHPVVCVTWNDANEFCRWLSGKEGVRYRLPTEAEWEYAYRAGLRAAYIWGNDPNAGQGWANCADLSAKDVYPDWVTFNWSDDYVYTSPAGSFRPNAWGLFDMAGNAWQWCTDWYAEYASGDVVDPVGPADGAKRILRGGAWFGAPCSSRAAYRSRISPSYRGQNVGFRVVMDVTP
jgi:formylglycine-generating enzyme